MPDATIVLLANIVKDEIAPKIVAAKEDEFVIPATRNLVADQREYDLPSDKVSSVSRIEAKFASDGDFIKLKYLDLNKYGESTQESIIVSNFSNLDGEAYYDLIRNSLYIYSGTIVSVTSGLKIWYSEYPADISSSDLALSTDLSIPASSTSMAVPRIFHELWARRVSIMWKQNRDKAIPLTERELLFSVDFDEAISNYKGADTDRDLYAGLPDDSRLQV